MPRWLVVIGGLPIEGAFEREEPGLRGLLVVVGAGAPAAIGNRLAAAEVVGRRGASVAPDDGSLLMVAKGSR
ncbi:hypothetical protein GW17_00036430 [Ensete ventricosum]|nr:hypothetical protein GW17_00036430 [Ensete ventricosum]